MIFIKTEKTRKDYGILFSYLLEKHFFRGYFNNESNFENCINSVNDYNLEFNNGNLIPLEELLLNDHFLNTDNYNVLIRNLVEGLSYIPMHNLTWEIDNQLIGDNFLYDNIFQHSELPYYYIMHKNSHFSSFVLINKITGKYFPYKMFEVLPSKLSNIINGKFDQEDFDEYVYYSLEFEIDESGENVINNKKTIIKDLIKIPESEYANCINIDIMSSIIPEGTNIHFEKVPLVNHKDIEFRDNLLALMNNKNENELPF
jgi:hypothetical protein